KTQIATIQIRSKKECQYRRKSNVRSPSAYSAVKGTPDLSELGATVAPLRDWAGSITAKYWLGLYNQRGVRKSEGGKIRLKNTFADGDGITRLDEKTSALSLGEALRINLEHVISAGVLSSPLTSFRRGNSCISTSHSDRLQ